MNTRIAFAACLILVLFPIVSHGEVWNLGDDFSATENPNGAWAFGWRASPSDPLILYTDASPWPMCPPDPNVHCWSYNMEPLALQVSKNANDHIWSCNGCNFPPNAVWFHPGPEQQSVVRWTAPTDTRIVLEAHFLALDMGSSIVHVYVGGSESWSGTLEDIGASADCFLTATCSVGDIIDIAIDAISFVDDSVQLDVVIGPPVGACCFPSGGCLVGTEADCQTAGGTYMGDGVTCDPDPCGATPVEKATWGQIKVAYK